MANKRTFLPAQKGSLTIEAALVIPIFMLLITAILHFLIIIALQGDIQNALDETAREFGKRAYVTEEAELLSGAAINPLTVKNRLLSGALRDRLDNSQIEGGSSGLHTYLTTYNPQTGILDIVVFYTYNVPFLPRSFGRLRFVQREQSRAWIGKSLKEGAEDSKNLVYITPTGTAYHKTKACPYLDLSVRSVRESSVNSLRNKSGAKYYRCPRCAKRGSFVVVYVTDYGTSWHGSLECSALKRNVTAVDISEVGDRHPCSKCTETEK